MYRSINAEFWTDPKIDRLSPLARYLFLYCITNPHSHMSGIYPVRLSLMQEETALTSVQFKTAFTELLKEQVIHYQTDEKMLWVTNMLSYQASGQQVWKGVAYHLRRLHHSTLIPLFLKRYPEIRPSLEQIGYQYPSDRVGDRGSSKDYPVPISDLLIPLKKGRESERGGEGFEAFWQVYPRKIGKGAARKVWMKLKPDSGFIEQICQQVQSACQTDQWQREGGKYIPHPATWLSQSRWEDDYSQRSPVKTEGFLDRMNKLAKGERL